MDVPEPARCPNGHQLAYPNVIVGWSPCQCRPLPPGDRGPAGHPTQFCLTCRWQWRAGGCELEGEWHDTTGRSAGPDHFDRLRDAEAAGGERAS